MVAPKLYGLKQLSLCLLLGIGLAGNVEGQESEFPQVLQQLIGDVPET